MEDGPAPEEPHLLLREYSKVSNPGSTVQIRQLWSDYLRKRLPQSVTSKVSTDASKSLYQSRPQTVAFSKEKLASACCCWQTMRRPRRFAPLTPGLIIKSTTQLLRYKFVNLGGATCLGALFLEDDATPTKARVLLGDYSNVNNPDSTVHICQFWSG